MIEIIREKNKWNNIIESCEYNDVYHTYDYTMLAKNKEDTPILIVYTHNNILIALPLLLRNIPNSVFFDITSVYGYVGPIFKGVTKGFDCTTYTEELKATLVKENIITVFSRLNPFIPFQELLLHNLGSIKIQGKIVAIDLTKSMEEQRRQYQKRLKTQINKARRHCTVREGKSKSDLEEFIAIYTENMQRVQASDFYYFNREYFSNICKSKSFKTIILLASEVQSGITIGGALFLIKQGIVHYHLSGTKNDFLHLMPNKLLLEEMRLKATVDGYKVFNFGGGLGGSCEDSLFKFKASYSKNFMDFKVWNLVVDQLKYEHLLTTSKTEVDSDFFPEYRRTHI